MRSLSHEEAEKLGVTANHEIMDSGEARFRLQSDDGSSYVRTVAGDRGSWQSSHRHAEVMESYIVQLGWIVIAELATGKLLMKILMPGEVATSPPNTPHNVYVAAGAIFHTIKHGQSVGADWTAVPELDELTVHLSEADVLEKARSAEA